VEIPAEAAGLHSELIFDDHWRALSLLSLATVFWYAYLVGA